MLLINELLFPYEINVNYYKVIGSNTIEVKTYEKGIESTMQSCASGSFVCAYDFSNKQNIIREIEVLNDGGNFKVMFDRVSLIQIVIKKIEAKVYLEIGVFKGYSFLKTICKNKIGIATISNAASINTNLYIFISVNYVNNQ